MAAIADLTPLQRPDVTPPQALRTVGDLTPRNLTSRPVVRGGWSAAISGGESFASPRAQAEGPGSIKELPTPARRWSQPRWQSGGTASAWTSRAAAPATTAPISRTSIPSSSPAIGGVWRLPVASGYTTALPQQPGAAMEKALRPGAPQGFARRASVGRPVQLLNAPSRDQLEEVIQATYRQLLNRELVAADRLKDPESQLRDGQLNVAEFVAQVAGSDLFLQRLARLAPLRAAAAAYLALLGRAAQPRETSQFLATRVRSGLPAAIETLLNSTEYAGSFGQNTVP